MELTMKQQQHQQPFKNIFDTPLKINMSSKKGPFQ